MSIIHSEALLSPIGVGEFINFGRKGNAPSFLFQNQSETSTKATAHLFANPDDKENQSAQRPVSVQPLPQPQLVDSEVRKAKRLERIHRKLSFVGAPPVPLTPTLSKSSRSMTGNVDSASSRRHPRTPLANTSSGVLLVPNSHIPNNLTPLLNMSTAHTQQQLKHLRLAKLLYMKHQQMRKQSGGSSGSASSTPSSVLCRFDTLSLELGSGTDNNATGGMSLDTDTIQWEVTGTPGGDSVDGSDAGSLGADADTNAEANAETDADAAASPEDFLNKTTVTCLTGTLSFLDETGAFNVSMESTEMPQVDLGETSLLDGIFAELATKYNCTQGGDDAAQEVLAPITEDAEKEEEEEARHDTGPDAESEPEPEPEPETLMGRSRQQTVTFTETIPSPPETSAGARKGNELQGHAEAVAAAAAAQEANAEKRAGRKSSQCVKCVVM